MIFNSDHSSVQRFDENHASHNAPRGVMATDGNKVLTGTPTPGRVPNADNLLSTDVTGLFEQLFRRTTPPMKKPQEVIHFEDGEHHVHGLYANLAYSHKYKLSGCNHLQVFVQLKRVV